MATSDELVSECLRQLKPRGGEEAEEEQSWKDKPLHCIYNWQIEEVAKINQSCQWLEKVGLIESTEVFT